MMRYLLFSFLLAILFTGCKDVHEEITLAADGSGQYALQNDLGNLITVAGQMSPDIPGWPYGGRAIDSSYTLLELAEGWMDKRDIPDALLSQGRVRIQSDSAQNKLDIRLEMDYNHPDELNKLLAGLQSVELKETSRQVPASVWNMIGSRKINWRIEGNTFYRDAMPIDIEALSKSAGAEISEQDLSLIRMVIGTGNYIARVKLPKPVTTVTGDLWKIEGSDLVLQIPIQTLFDLDAIPAVEASWAP